MCGRYRLNRSQLALAAAAGALPKFQEFSETRITHHFDDLDFTPSKQVPIIRLENDQRVTDHATWGFVRPGGSDKPSFNARGETVARLPMFREAFRSSRCLLMTDGFYEPKGPKTGKRRQQFYFHRPDHSVFAMAGIFSRTTQGLTCALITIGPNAMMAPIHERMPVILQPNDYDKWLDPAAKPHELQALLKPAPDDYLVFEAVTPPVEEGPSLFD
jgi:putative SOS response-associated peptidase YedK